MARVPLGSALSTLLAGGDGGAWVRIERRNGSAIGRATPGGAFTVRSVDLPLSDNAAVGPDGQAWFSGLFSVARSDAAGALTRLQFDSRLGDVSVTGADGTLWSASEDALARVTPQGTVSDTALTLPKCSEQVQFRDMTRASDGAAWIADSGCSRLIRLAPDGTPTVFALGADEAPYVLAPDASGGVWFGQVGTPVRIGHADVNGTVTRLRPSSKHGAVTDVAVGPDGSAWFAFASCALGRIAPGGTFAFTSTPIPARQLAFDPAGGLWLASGARLVHTTVPELERGSCDDRPPKVRLRPGLRGKVSLAQLRHGVKVTVREPAMVSATPFYGSDDDGHSFVKIVRAVHGGTVTFHVPASRVREYERDLAKHRKPELSLYVEATDREGNLGQSGGGGLRVTR